MNQIVITRNDSVFGVKMLLLQGILGLSWCHQDPSMILTTGKDSRTVLWDVNGTQLGSTVSPSAYFDVQFSPTDPGIFATSSYGGGDGQDGTVSPLQLLYLPMKER